LGHSEKVVNYKGTVVPLLHSLVKVKNKENYSYRQVQLISEAIKLLKVVVHGVLRWGNAVMNMPSTMDHTHSKDHCSMQMLTYLGPW